MSIRVALYIACLAASGCGAGVSDHTFQVGSAPYEVAVTDSNNAWLYPRTECGPKCPSIPSNVVWAQSGPGAVAVRRQVARFYQCQEGVIAEEILNRYEQYVITLGNREVFGPMTIAEYRAFVAGHPELMVGIPPLPAEAANDGRGEVLSPLGKCTDPRET